MNEIIERLQRPYAGLNRLNNPNQIIGGIGTLEGRIWLAYQSRKVVKMPIISSDRSIPIHQPIMALRNLVRGPTGSHDIKVLDTATVELLYCHQTVCKITSETNAKAILCGRTYMMFCEMEEHTDCDSGDDESLEYELKDREHLRVSSGVIKVRVSAAGHRVYMCAGVRYKICKSSSNTT